MTDPRPAPQIIQLEVAKIRPAEWNYKQHGSEGAREKLKRSIVRDRTAGVLAVRELPGGSYEAIDGNHRLEAVAELGWQTIHCENFGQISLAEAVTIGRRRNHEWFQDTAGALDDLLRDVVLPEIAVPELAEFMPESFEDLERLLDPTADEKGKSEDDDIPPTPADPITKPGDIWTLGAHRLMCGSSSSAEDVAQLMGEDKVHIVVTSPPYDNSESYEKGKSREDWEQLMDGFCMAFGTHLAEGGIFALNMGNRVGWNNVGFSGYCLERAGLRYMRRVVWKKPDGAGIPSHGHTHKKPQGLNWHPMMVTEDILFYSKGEKREPMPGHKFPTAMFSENYTDCWEFPGVHSDKKQGHPAAFPKRLPRLILSFCSVVGDVVAEPFSGSGTTLVVAERLGRRCRAMEISPAYCDVAVMRWEAMTKQKAVKVER